MVLAAIEAGDTDREAARKAGIHRGSMYRNLAEGRKPGAREELAVFAADFARAGAERSRKAVTRELVTDAVGREIGTRTRRVLKNRTVEVTEEFARPDRRALLAQVRASISDGDGPLDVLFGLGGD